MKTHLLTSTAGTLALAFLALCGNRLNATPYASSITNDGTGNMTFYLNEGGGNVTVVYEDNSTNANYNGITTGTNLAAGPYVFAMGTHTSYSIMVYKLGPGAPTLIATSPGFTPRGIDVNRHPASKYFGRVYADASGAGGIFAMNPDMTFTFGGVKAAGVSWANNGFSPYRCYVADDDYLMVGDASFTGGAGGSGNDGVWRVDPDINAAQLFLGPKGESAGLSAGVHATIGSRPILLGNIQNGPVTLLDVDMDFPAINGANSLLVYTNITLASLPWQTAPDIQGPEVGLNLASTTLGGNSYPGLQISPDGKYIYAGTYRENYSNPLLQIYTNDIGNGDSLVQVWNSLYNGGTADYFRTTVSGLTHGTVDIAVSPDGRYVAGVSIDNWFVICPLTNGIPDVGNLFTTTPTSTSGNARGLTFDAADNLYLSSSGIGLCQSWTLGITSLATTRGNTNGSTSFEVAFPSTQVNVVATTPDASQGGADGVVGTPVPGVFTITRTNANNDYSSPITVNFTLTGTATNGVYTVSPSGTPAAANSVVLLPGVTSTNISIVPSTANVPRLETTVILTVLGGPSYSVAQPSKDTVYIQNTSSNQLVLSAAAPTMYKAYAIDFASITLTRLGDTNVASYTVPASAFTYAGTAVSNVDFTAVAPVTFNPGDVTQHPTISPLSNGVPPIDTINPVYTGNKSVTVGLVAGAGYLVSGANASTLTLIDNAELPNAVLFTDPLTDPADAANWAITYASGNLPNQGSDYNVDFGYDLTANNPLSLQNGLIGLPPSGATNALRITCNKQQPGGATYSGGVNVYYTNQAFHGNYAVRFNMNLVAGDNSFTVEGPIFGINHNGLETNWWSGGSANFISGPWASDGVWYWVQAPPGGAGGFGFTEFEEYTGLGGALPNTGWQNPANIAAMPNVFKHAVFTAPGGLSGGTPANNSPVSASPADNSWSDVEVKQVNHIVTMSINKTQIFQYTNATHFTNGYIMLGYDSPLGGAFNNYLTTPDAAVYISNLRVVSLTPPDITGIGHSQAGGTNSITINFSSFDADDSAASFALQGATVVTGPYADVAGATITQVLGNDQTAAHFQATTTSTNAVEFYRIRHR